MAATKISEEANSKLPPAQVLPYEEQAMRLCNAQYGPDHDVTVDAKNNLAYSYMELERYADAAKLFGEVLPLRRIKPGTAHPQTVGVMSALGWAYGYVGRHAEASKLFEEALAIRLKVLAKDDEQVLRNMNSLALSYALEDRPGDAMKLLNELLPMARAKFGVDHQFTKNLVQNIEIARVKAGAAKGKP